MVAPLRQLAAALVRAVQDPLQAEVAPLPAGDPRPRRQTAAGLLSPLPSFRRHKRRLSIFGRPELVRLLDAAGVPHDPAQSVAVLRDKCSAAAWAAEKLRSPSDVRSLAGTAPNSILMALGIHTAWKQEAQDRVLDAMLRECRHSSWGPDPATAHGIVCATRSTIFRLTQRVTLPDHQGASTRLDTHLSADELSLLAAQLGPVGLSLDDIHAPTVVGRSSRSPTRAPLLLLLPHRPIRMSRFQPWNSSCARCTSNHTPGTQWMSART